MKLFDEMNRLVTGSPVQRKRVIGLEREDC